MRITITRLDPNLPLPAYNTDGAAGFDFYCRCDTEVEPGGIALVPANVVVKVPDGYVLLVALRSSTPRRLGLVSPNGIGVIDSDYCGPRDEIAIEVYNATPRPVTVVRGDRIAQGMVIPAPTVEWDEQIAGDGPSRGGFGSTGA